MLATAADPAAVVQRTVGIEQELLLARRSDWSLAPRSSIVIDDPASQQEFQHEFKREQIEIATSPCTTLAELSDDLIARRARLAAVAADHGLAACASATSPYAGAAHTFHDARYDRMIDELTLVGTTQLACAMHVHVSVESRDEGVTVLNQIRPWLAPLAALSSNSPFWQGADTGYASYRSVVLAQLPTSGPAPVWSGTQAYDECEHDLIATGAAFDPAMLYFDARLSPSYPTVEIRVMDVCQRVDAAIALAGLCRALVDQAGDRTRSGIPPIAIQTPVIRAASWRAWRYGMTNTLFDPSTRQQMPAWDLVGAMFEQVSSALIVNGDADRVRAALDRIRAEGTGAEQQRKRYRRTASFEVVLASTDIGNAELSGRE